MIDTKIKGSIPSQSLAGHPEGSKAFDILENHVDKFRDQALLGRGFETYEGRELKEHDIHRSRKDTVEGLRHLGMGTAEAKETVRTVERQVTAVLDQVLGDEIGHRP